MPAFSMPSRRFLALAGIAVLLLLSGCSEMPPPFCTDCSETLDAVESEGVDVPENATELHVYVEGNGTARWQLQVPLDATTASELRSDPARLDAIGDRIQERMAERRSEDADPWAVDWSARVEGRTLVIGFSRPSTVHAGPGGVVVFDGFYDPQADRDRRLVDLDRVVVHGPDGKRVTRSPDDATVDDQSVAFQRGRPYSGDVPTDALIAFAPDEKPTTAFAQRVTVGMVIAPIVVVQLGFSVGPTFVILGSFVGALLVLGVTFGERFPVRWLAGGALVLVGLVAAGTLTVFFMFGTPSVAGITTGDGVVSAAVSLVGLGSLVAALVGTLVAPLYVDRDRLGRAIRLGGLGVTALSLAALGVFVVFGVPGIAASIAGLLVPTLLFWALGHAIGTEARERWLFAAAILVLPAGIVLPMLPASSALPLLFGFVVMPVWGIVTAAIGGVLFVSGYVVAVDADPAEFGLPTDLPFRGSSNGWN